MLYKFENDQKNFGCVGSCGYAPTSLNYKFLSRYLQWQIVGSSKIFFINNKKNAKINGSKTTKYTIWKCGRILNWVGVA